MRADVVRLAKNFTLAEMTRSRTALLHGIANDPGACQVAALRLLSLVVLQPVRDALGPVSVSSGFRSAELNSRISREPNSQHVRGEAADFEIPGEDNLEVARWIASSSIPFDQLILEFHTVGDSHSGWIHLSHAASRAQRGQVLHTRPRPGGGVIYAEGLP